MADCLIVWSQHKQHPARTSGAGAGVGAGVEATLGAPPSGPFSTPFPIVRAAADAGCQKLMLTRRFPFDLVTRLPQRARPALLLRRNQ